jgi:RND family efflux transporter MFP subunit
MKRRKSAQIVLLAAALASAAALGGCGGHDAETAPAPQNVVLWEVAEGGGAEEMSWSGVIKPAESAKLSFKVAGVIAEVAVGEGEAVMEGQTLARLKSGDYEIQARAAEAQWQSAVAQAESVAPETAKAAKAQLDLTLANYERVRLLYEELAAPESALDELSAKKKADEAAYEQALEALDIGRAEAERARAAYDMALGNLADVEIRAPWDGVVMQQVAEAGEIVAAGYPVLAVGRVSEMLAEIGVTDVERGRLEAGMRASVHVFGPDDVWTGEVEEVGALADSMTRNFTVRVRLDNADARLLAGMAAQVSIELPTEARVMAPMSSVIHLAGGDVAYVYDAAEGRARRRAVETGEITGDKVEILAGLEAGDMLIVEGQSKIKDGDEVSPL